MGNGGWPSNNAIRLPAWLRTETLASTWKDLRLPALLAAASVILGILIIT